MPYPRGAQPFLGQGPQCIIFSALEGRRQNYEPNFRELSIKTEEENYLTGLFVAHGLILLPSELFRIVISCKINFNSSMKFDFIYKISIIQENFLVFFNLFRGPDITRSGTGSGPRFVHPCHVPCGDIARKVLAVLDFSGGFPFILGMLYGLWGFEP